MSCEVVEGGSRDQLNSSCHHFWKKESESAKEGVCGDCSDGGEVCVVTMAGGMGVGMGVEWGRRCGCLGCVQVTCEHQVHLTTAKHE